MTKTAEAAIPNHMLSELGNVPASYRHEWRVATPAEPLLLPGSIFKWYHVHREGLPVPPELDAEAREITTQALAAGRWDPSYGLSIAILHVSTSHAFLLLGAWCGHQELWLRIYARELGAAAPFARIGTSGEDAPGGCVWELGVTCHERMAWHRYLFSDRAVADNRAWLEDRYAGPV